MNLLRLSSTVDGNKNRFQFGKAIFDLFFEQCFELISSVNSQAFMAKNTGQLLHY